MIAVIFEAHETGSGLAGVLPKRAFATSPHDAKNMHGMT